MLQVVTCANDARASDLERLLLSLARLAPEADAVVIPFDDDDAQVRVLADRHGARLLARDPFWDALGTRIFGSESYRPGVSAAAYFRKLNMFNDPPGSRLYLDANCLLLSGEAVRIDETQPAKHHALFHSASVRGRNFSAATQTYIDRIAPWLRQGFNLGHMVFTPMTADRIRAFAEAWGGESLRARFGPAPEQSFVNFALAHVGVRARLLAGLDSGLAATNTPAFAIARGADGAFRYVEGRMKGKRLHSVKKSGSAGSPSVGYSMALQAIETERDTQAGHAGSRTVA